MPYIPQAESQLTKDQSQVLGKLKAYSNYGLNVPKTDLFIPKNQQISMFDFMKKIFNSIGGEAMFQNLLKTFVTKLFDKTTDLLEKQIIKALAGALDKQNITISKGVSNKVWLEQNVLPKMNIAKDQVLALILALIFGPPSTISTLMNKFNTKNGYGEKPVTPSSCLQMSVCSQLLYTMSNLPDQGVGDLEYKKLQLTEQITTGGIAFDISCQRVVIQMPTTVLAQIVPVVGEIPGSTPKPFNPHVAVNTLDNWIQTEVSRQNIPENKSSASKSFWEGFVEKLLNLIMSAVSPQLNPIFALINKLGNPIKILVDKITGHKTETPVTVEKDSLTSDPCTIYNLGIEEIGTKKHSPEKDTKSAFLSILLNAILGILLAILLQQLIKLVKKLLKKILAKKAADLAQRLIKKRLQVFEDTLGAATAQAAKTAKLVKALAHLQPILEFLK
jgi:hypothetical protein